MKIFLTGATGFVGQHTVPLLLAAGHELHALVRKTSPYQPLQQQGVHLHFGDLDARSALKLPEGMDGVIHIAGLIKAKRRQDFYRVNLEGTKQLVEAFAPHPPRHFIFVSSIAARGPNRTLESLQGDGPVSDYGRSKAQAEAYLQLASLPYSLNIVRPPVVYGSGDRETLILYKMFRRGLFMKIGSRPLKTSLIHVQDLAKALVALAEQQRSSVEPLYTEDGAEGHGLEDFQVLVSELYAKKLRVIRVPELVGYLHCLLNEGWARLRGRAPMIARDKFNELKAGLWFCSSQGLTDLIGWKAEVVLQEGFAGTDRWYRQAGWL